MELFFSCYRPSRPDEPFLLADDIDGTLLGDEQGADWLKAFSCAYPGSFYLALVTGRSLPSILTLIEEGRLPQPDFICCDVGTELLVCAPWHYHSPLPAARGVLDGLKFFGFIEEVKG